jgi:hypothetical protein
MTGTLDQTKFGPSLGGCDEVAGVGVRDFNVLGSMADEEPTRWHFRYRHQGVDSQDVVTQLLSRQEVLLTAHHTSNLHRSSKLFRTPTPRFEMRWRRERRDAANAFIIGGDAKRQGASESETGEGDSSFTLIHSVEDLA